MSDALLVLCTCENQEQAQRIARTLVEERLAACANILPGVVSTFRWQGEVSEANEIQLFVKTAMERYQALERRIAELHSYDTPEIIAIPITAGSEKYLRWLREQL